MWDILSSMFNGGVALLVEYVTQHTLTCLIPAFFAAGLINTIVPKSWIMKVLGGANKALAYILASASGIFFSVCSCTVIPFFAGVYKRGAGLGPAMALLYSWPAINIAAFALTGSVFGAKMALLRAVFAILIAFVVGNVIEFAFPPDKSGQKGKKAILRDEAKVKKSKKELFKEWMKATWDFFLMIFPYLLVGVFLAGAIRAVLPQDLVTRYVGGDSLWSCFLISFLGMFSYFSSLTEVPLTQTLVSLGMGRGAALSEFLADPALSLPSALAVSKIIGWKRTVAYLSIVVLLSTLIGWLMGSEMLGWVY
jgi:hypothetical protein